MLAEWGLPPEYIMANWTDEELTMMSWALRDRKMRESGRIPDGGHMVSDARLFGMLGNKVKVVKRGH